MPRISAQAIIKAASGSSVLDARRPIEPKKVDRYSVSEYRIRKAADILKSLGLQPVQIGTASITVEADKATFEDLLQCGIEQKTKKMIQGHKGEVAYYQFKGVPRIPDELAEFVTAIALPEPPELFP